MPFVSLRLHMRWSGRCRLSCGRVVLDADVIQQQGVLRRIGFALDKNQSAHLVRLKGIH